VQNRYIGFKRDKIYKFARDCITCQRNQPLKRNEAIVPNNRWERLIIDFIDLRIYSEQNDGFGWILNIIDSYSKYIYAFAIKTKGSGEVCKCLKKVINIDGTPKMMHTDNGKEIVNSNVKKLCDLYKIQHVKGRPRHPQSQGQVERANQTIARKLAKTLQATNGKNGLIYWTIRLLTITLLGIGPSTIRRCKC